MPLCFDPNATFRVVLGEDAGSTAASARPTFVFRYLSYRQWRAREDFLDRLKAAGYRATGDLAAELYGLLRENLVGWENLPVPYDPAELDAVTCLDEALELLYASRRQSRLTEGELGNSPSPSPTSAAASAVLAPEAPASPDSAGTAPAAASPSA